jgi:hypothetical protein
MALSKSEAGKLGNLASKLANAKRKEDAIAAYNLNPNSCVHCSTAISYAKRNLNRYCSRKCAHAVNNPLKPEKTEKINSICEHCSTEFRHKKEGRTRSFCSQVCYLKNQTEQNMQRMLEGTCSGPIVKRHLIELHGNRCLDPECTWDFIKRPINVELEHIDGNSSNNTLENCTLLCPNCHSLTDTYKWKNLGKGRKTLRKLKAAEQQNKP